MATLAHSPHPGLRHRACGHWIHRGWNPNSPGTTGPLPVPTCGGATEATGEEPGPPEPLSGPLVVSNGTRGPGEEGAFVASELRTGSDGEGGTVARGWHIRSHPGLQSLEAFKAQAPARAKGIPSGLGSHSPVGGSGGQL